MNAPAWINVPWLLTSPGHISETTKPVSIKFSVLNGDVFTSLHSWFHRDQTRLKVCFLPLRPAHSFGEIQYMQVCMNALALLALVDPWASLDEVPVRLTSNMPDTVTANIINICMIQKSKSVVVTPFIFNSTGKMYCNAAYTELTDWLGGESNNTPLARPLLRWSFMCFSTAMGYYTNENII